MSSKVNNFNKYIVIFLELIPYINIRKRRKINFHSFLSYYLIYVEYLSISNTNLGPLDICGRSKQSSSLYLVPKFICVWWIGVLKLLIPKLWLKVQYPPRYLSRCQISYNFRAIDNICYWKIWLDVTSVSNDPDNQKIPSKQEVLTGKC